MPDNNTKSPKGSDWREMVRAMTDPGDATIEGLDALIAEVTKMRDELSEKARKAALHTIHDDGLKAVIEREPDKRVFIWEAERYLSGLLDLNAAKTAAINSHRRYGLVDAVVQSGAISGAAQYGSLFMKATINAADLRKVREMLISGHKILPIFDPGVLTPDQMADVLFTKCGIDNYTDGFSFNNLVNLRKIDPKDISDLSGLHVKTREEQLAAFQSAYEAAPALTPTGPRILFTSDIHEVSGTGYSATLEMQDIASGDIRPLDPNADFLRVFTQMDEGLRKLAGEDENFDDMNHASYRQLLDKAYTSHTISTYMPDRVKATAYPNYVFPNGNVLFRYFNSGSRKMLLFSCPPNIANSSRGSRVSLG